MASMCALRIGKRRLERSTFEWDTRRFREYRLVLTPEDNDIQYKCFLPDHGDIYHQSLVGVWSRCKSDTAYICNPQMGLASAGTTASDSTDDRTVAADSAVRLANPELHEDIM